MRNTYIALTTINSQTNGYHALAAGHDKAKVEQAALDNIRGTDIYSQTKRINLRVVSKTAAKKLGYHFDSEMRMCERIADMEIYHTYTWVG